MQIIITLEDSLALKLRRELKRRGLRRDVVFEKLVQQWITNPELSSDEYRSISERLDNLEEQLKNNDAQMTTETT